MSYTRSAPAPEPQGGRRSPSAGRGGPAACGTQRTVPGVPPLKVSALRALLCGPSATVGGRPGVRQDNEFTAAQGGGGSRIGGARATRWSSQPPSLPARHGASPSAQAGQTGLAPGAPSTERTSGVHYPSARPPEARPARSRRRVGEEQKDGRVLPSPPGACVSLDCGDASLHVLAKPSTSSPIEGADPQAWRVASGWFAP